MKLSYKKTCYQLLALFFSCIACYFVIWAFSGNWPWVQNPYNSYVLQAKAWLSGRLDIAGSYTHLELASYQGKTFVSFPPLPSVILLPFVILGIPDGFLAVLISLLSAFFAFKLCKHFCVNYPLFWTLFLVIGSNVLLVSFNSWVWFIAQNTSFCLTLASLYFATRKRGVLALLLWALSIGARPFQVFYLPLLLSILLKGERGFSPKKYFKWFLIPAIIGILYMIFNFVRFGNIFEFGHNYLEEFLEAEKGQFHLSYIPKNLYSLIRLPEILPSGKLDFFYFNGINVFLVFPILIFAVLFSIKNIKSPQVMIGFLCAILQILSLCAHKTMGGWHFGHRYFIDVMPCFFYMLISSIPQNRNIVYLATPFFVLGFGVNLFGIITMFLA